MKMLEVKICELRFGVNYLGNVGGERKDNIRGDVRWTEGI
jgi:hypothetical protein